MRRRCVRTSSVPTDICGRRSYIRCSSRAASSIATRKIARVRCRCASSPTARSSRLTPCQTPPGFRSAPTRSDRDQLSRLALGTGLSLGVALSAALGALAIGALLGGLAGFVGGTMDDAVMRLADLLMALPALYVVLALRASMPLVLSTPEVFSTMVIVLALVGWPWPARGVRAVVAAERVRESRRSCARARRQPYAFAATSPSARGSRLPGRPGDALSAGVRPCRGHAVIRGSRVQRAHPELGCDVAGRRPWASDRGGSVASRPRDWYRVRRARREPLL